jgi:hypothetical protein
MASSVTIDPKPKVDPKVSSPDVETPFKKLYMEAVARREQLKKIPFERPQEPGSTETTETVKPIEQVDLTDKRSDLTDKRSHLDKVPTDAPVEKAKPKSSYVEFCRENRHLVQEKYPNYSFAQINFVLAKMFRDKLTPKKEDDKSETKVTTEKLPAEKSSEKTKNKSTKTKNSALEVKSNSCDSKVMSDRSKILEERLNDSSCIFGAILIIFWFTVVVLAIAMFANSSIENGICQATSVDRRMELENIMGYSQWIDKQTVTYKSTLPSKPNFTKRNYCGNLDMIFSCPEVNFDFFPCHYNKYSDKIEFKESNIGDVVHAFCVLGGIAGFAIFILLHIWCCMRMNED